ncbi:MAG: DUF480 domain-containing protein, partial [Planctomycetota bacterium]
WIEQLDKEGGRTYRYRHRADEQLAVERPALALLAELLCRGPQAPGALKTRASRMHSFGSPADVEVALEELAARPVPFVQRLPRQPREHAARWTHLLGRAATAGDASETATGPAESLYPDALPAAPARRPPPPLSTAPGGDVEALVSRIEELERVVARLRQRLDRLELR